MISQNALQSFQDEMGKVLNDPYKVFQLDAHWSAFMKPPLSQKVQITRNNFKNQICLKF